MYRTVRITNNQGQTVGEDSGKLILAIVQRTENALDKHIEAEEKRLTRINQKLDEHADDISSLEKSVALQQQRSGYINAFVAMMVAALVSWFANLFGARG